MSLTADQELLEHELRVTQMQTNIAKMQAELRWESRKFMLQVLVGAAACVAAGVGLANYVNSRPAAAPAPQVIYLVPGQAPPAPASR